ncbi:amidoligase enzyme-domain-containing protein [Penicillium samsonianum]|uniref:amidoligase enzyme-domain-containing protein n=1 Tax=Penicillium samsonianum TaxID=1882272 RepID=UPI0025494966|nr:amidoligase enzyme-domain-containing protein [Penicillium samsonianum]KAJ6128017.1 amidoligase enzyme-domain-containing protein [Penicillium samsonianum]
MARDSFYFGVEIELIAEPHVVRHSQGRRFYYEKLAASLRNHGLNAMADSLEGRYRKHSEHYDKWFLTKDGSLGNPAHPAIPIEAVSPVLSTSQHWETEIDLFWTSWGRVFELPRRSAKCGSHIHVSPGPNKRFTLTELKKIACGIVFYANNLNDMLPAPRRNNAYCQKNWETSRVGVWYENGSNNDVRLTMEQIWGVDDERELEDFMQDDRRVMWNFEHTVPGNRCTGTVEFRGGRGLRGPNRTKWWIAFVVSFIQLCISSKRFPKKSPSDRPQTDYFWRKVRKYARTIHVADDLPPDWHDLNESYSSGHWEDTVDSDEDESETSSIVSKGASQYWDSDYLSGDER